MDLLSVATQEVQEIFSDVVNDASVSLETLEASVGQACRELGRKVLEACFSQRAVSESDSVAGYFLKHAHRMRYQRFVDKGYHIGSGIIESACKHVVAERCKQAGMRWSQDGINAILFWRCLLKNGAWDAFWRKHANAA